MQYYTYFSISGCCTTETLCLTMSWHSALTRITVILPLATQIFSATKSSHIMVWHFKSFLTLACLNNVWVIKTTLFACIKSSAGLPITTLPVVAAGISALAEDLQCTAIILHVYTHRGKPLENSLSPDHPDSSILIIRSQTHDHFSFISISGLSMIKYFTQLFLGCTVTNLPYWVIHLEYHIITYRFTAMYIVQHNAFITRTVQSVSAASASLINTF